ncbi:MAG: hypothetical protein Q7T20_07290 [Saprospiraceae bacterium]|nr:hypothetical protein [Saprospiraceae bacterium]
MNIFSKPRFFHLALGAMFFAIFAVFIIPSCKKETTNLEIKASDRDGEDILTPSCEDYCSECGDDVCTPSTVLEAITDTGDASNNKVNIILFHYAQAVREAAKNTTYRQYIENALTVNNVGVSVSLLTLSDNNSSFATFLNSKLRQSMSENNIYPRGVVTGIDSDIADTTWDANSFLKGELAYGSDSYDPVVYYLSKPDAGAANYPVSVLIAQEVNDCDDVAGWKGDTPALVGETEGRDDSRSVMIVGPGADGNTSEGLAPPPTEAPAGDRVTTTVNMKNLKIKGLNYRYEKNGKSEVTGCWIKFSPSPVVKNGYNFYLKVCKDDIKNQTTISSNINIVSDSDWNSNSYWIGFYEYDWYAFGSNWTMPTPSGCTTETVKTQRKFIHEWYNYDFCGTGLSYFGSTSGGDATQENSKSKFVITGL